MSSTSQLQPHQSPYQYHAHILIPKFHLRCLISIFLWLLQSISFCCDPSTLPLLVTIFPSLSNLLRWNIIPVLSVKPVNPGRLSYNLYHIMVSEPHTAALSSNSALSGPGFVHAGLEHIHNIILRLGSTTLGLSDLQTWHCTPAPWGRFPSASDQRK